MSSHYDQTHGLRFSQGKDGIGYRALLRRLLHEALLANLSPGIAIGKLLKLARNFGMVLPAALLIGVRIRVPKLDWIRRVQDIL